MDLLFPPPATAAGRLPPPAPSGNPARPREQSPRGRRAPACPPILRAVRRVATLLAMALVAMAAPRIRQPGGAARLRAIGRRLGVSRRGCAAWRRGGPFRLRPVLRVGQADGRRRGLAARGAVRLPRPDPRRARGRPRGARARNRRAFLLGALRRDRPGDQHRARRDEQDRCSRRAAAHRATAPAPRTRAASVGVRGSAGRAAAPSVPVPGPNGPSWLVGLDSFLDRRAPPHPSRAG